MRRALPQTTRLLVCLGAVTALVLSLLVGAPASTALERPERGVVCCKTFPFNPAGAVRALASAVNANNRADARKVADAGVVDRMFAKRRAGVRFGGPRDCRTVSGQRVRCLATMKSGTRVVGTARLTVYGSGSSGGDRVVAGP